MQTNRHSRSDFPWQNDYIHARKRLAARLVSCVGMDETLEATGLPLPDRYALVSLLLGIAAVAASVVFLLYTASLVGSGDGTLNLEQENILDFLYSLISSGNLMGLFLGIASLSTPNRKRPAALIGTIINGLLFIGLLWLII